MAEQKTVKEIINFNKNCINKNHYTKADFQQIFRVYERSKSTNCTKYEREFYKGYSSFLFSAAARKIEAFAYGKLSVSPDAMNEMNKFIELFGHSKVNSGEYTLMAKRAKAMINKQNHHSNNKVQPCAAINKTPAPQSTKSKTPVAHVLGADVKNVKANKHKAEVAKVTATPNVKQKVAVVSHALNKVKQMLPSATEIKTSIQSQAKVEAEYFKEACKTTAQVGAKIYQKTRRCAVAFAAFWGLGTMGNINVDANNTTSRDYIKDIKGKITEVKLPTQNIEVDEKTKVLTAEDFNVGNAPEFDENDAYQWLADQGIHLAPKEPVVTADTTTQTIGSFEYSEYHFSREELEEMEPTEKGRELTEHAIDVAAKMNNKGYCYRAVKRMFNRADLGKMEGRSAYMAKEYLDKNPNFVRINCSFEDLKFLPSGSVVVYGKSKKHPHGHIGVLGEVNDKTYDFSSKKRNGVNNINAFGGFTAYILADTKIPARVKENIKNTMVYNHQEEKEKTPVISSFWQQLQNQKSSTGIGV